MEYQPEYWSIDKSDIYSSIESLKIALSYVKDDLAKCSEKYEAGVIKDLFLIENTLNKLIQYPKSVKNE